MEGCFLTWTQSFSIALATTLLILFHFFPHTYQPVSLQSDGDPHISVARKELIATEKAEEEARHELREAEDQVSV